MNITVTDNRFLELCGKNKCQVAITLSRQKILIFIVILYHRLYNLKLIVLLMEGNGNNKYSDNSDNGKDNISENDNKSNIKIVSIKNDNSNNNNDNNSFR